VIKEAIDRILSLSEPHTKDMGGITYTDKTMSPIVPPKAMGVTVNTLQGLADLYARDIDGVTTGEALVHIVGPQTVALIAKKSDEYGRRQIWATAQYPSDIQRFQFGSWMNTENFIIGLQSCFQRTYIEKPDGKVIGDWEYVLKVASNVSAESKVTNSDDGISQNVEMAKGIVLKEQATLKSRVMLAPFRTFSEVDQPLSTFVFRVRESNGSIHLALFEADGGRWRLDAVAGIAKWLKGKFGTAPIIT
jgi:hypothetical protein